MTELNDREDGIAIIAMGKMAGRVGLDHGHC